MLVPTDKSKETLKKYRTKWNKIRDLIRSITNYSHNYEKYLKIKCKLDDDLPLKKMLNFYNMVIAVRSVFHEDNKYYRQDFVNGCLYSL